ncbi:MAG TPA: sigma 54-interacting transcriptional regulator, partial [Thermodesulfobacteriota bacterium]|nr:sigma 54-interacting transcriptional regulator [Thermodesulfobacteriota bacterium]
MTKHQGLDSVIQFFQKKLTNVPGSWEYNSALCNALITASGAEAASIWRLDSRRCLHIVYSTDIPRDQLPQFTLGPGEGISGAAALSCKTLIVSDARSHPHYDDRVDNHMSSRTRSLICAPIISDGFLYGVLNILNLRTAAPLPHEWSELLSLCATLYATVLSTDGQLLPFSSKPTAANHRSEEEQHVPSIVGISPSIQDALHLCLKAARSDVPVLIRGETGTGKELAAHRIHEASGRCKGPFLAVNCAALTETLLESELFGHVKGAFTGALRDRQGKFVAAEGGTLFLDDIGEMSTSSQARILRALEEHTVTPV